MADMTIETSRGALIQHLQELEQDKLADTIRVMTKNQVEQLFGYMSWTEQDVRAGRAADEGEMRNGIVHIYVETIQKFVQWTLYSEIISVRPPHKVIQKL